MNIHTARTNCFVALFLGALASPAIAAESTPAKPAADVAPSTEKHLLRYKFAHGEILRYDVKHATKTRNNMEGVDEQVETQSDSVKEWRVTDVLPNGEMEFIHVVKWIKMSNDSPDRPTNAYDSRTDAKPPRGFEQAARAVGITLSVVRISADGKVTFREQKHPMPKAQEDMPITLGLPENAIAVGEKWSHPYDVVVTRKSGANQQIQSRRVCKLREVTNGVAVIDVEYQVLTPIDPYVRAQLVERLTDGTVRFDIAKGRIVQQEHNVDKRVLGYAGKASSMHYVSRLQERLLPAESKTSGVQQASAVVEKK